ncbi:MAG: DUF418 domain-containing protein [Endozoicomonadaceae bacterium]|nr:DUF418 domain-containing protein [Endozoicomonadaceae bacterium]
MKNRIIAIDVLRGFALLGILLMNIMSFSMPDIAYLNPTTYGGDDIWNRFVYCVTHLIADQKFMALFSMLFGASVILLANSLSTNQKNPAKAHYIRNMWLFIIGLIHATLIWDGDILMIYAVSSFMLYFFRNVAPKWQLLLGLTIYLLPSLLNLSIQYILHELDTTSRQALIAYWQPSQKEIEYELAHFRGGYAKQVAYRWQTGYALALSEGKNLLNLSFLVDLFARAFGMMLAGMALYSWGILTAQRSDNFYRRMLIIGFSLGIPLALLGLGLSILYEWQWQYVLFLERIPNHLATPFIASGYIALIMLWSRRPIWLFLREPLAAVGRTALTNYIGQSLIATFIFYGFGLGLYGHVDRITQLSVIFAIWVIQLFVASWWLSHFHYGPLEWLLRVLTYLEWQPIRRGYQAIHSE